MDPRLKEDNQIKRLTARNSTAYAAATSGVRPHAGPGGPAPRRVRSSPNVTVIAAPKRSAARRQCHFNASPAGDPVAVLYEVQELKVEPRRPGARPGRRCACSPTTSGCSSRAGRSSQRPARWRSAAEKKDADPGRVRRREPPAQWPAPGAAGHSPPRRTRWTPPPARSASTCRWRTSPAPSTATARRTSCGGSGRASGCGSGCRSSGSPRSCADGKSERSAVRAARRRGGPRGAGRRSCSSRAATCSVRKPVRVLHEDRTDIGDRQRRERHRGRLRGEEPGRRASTARSRLRRPAGERRPRRHEGHNH